MRVELRRSHGTPAPPPPPPSFPTPAEMGNAPFDRSKVFTPDSFWRRDIRSAPLHPNSRPWVVNLCNQMDVDPVNGGGIAGSSGGKAWIGTTSGTYPVYVIPAGHPTRPVAVRTMIGQDVGYGASLLAPDLHRELQKGVPLPENFQVGSNVGDSTVMIYQPSSDTLWDLFSVKYDATYGVTVRWGSVMYEVSKNIGWHQTRRRIDGTAWQGEFWGSSATSMPGLGGLATAEEVQTNSLNTALRMVVGNAAQGVHLYPANRDDGANSTINAATGYNVYIPEGARIRLPDDPTARAKINALDPRFMPIYDAMIKYGVIVSDKTFSGCALMLRDYNSPTGHNRWADVYTGYPAVPPNRYMWAMPWHLAEIIAPDFNR